MNQEYLKKCIVRIEVESYDSDKAETFIVQGTGFFIEKDKILTCYHVIKNYEDLKDIKVFLNNEEPHYEVNILDINKDIDFALLKIESDNTFFVERDETISVEDKCYSHGFPDKEEYNKQLKVPKDKQIKDKPLTFEYEGSDTANKLMTFKGGQFEKGFSGSPILNLSTGAVCGMIVISRDTRTDLGGEGVSIDKLSLLNYKDKIETNSPINISIIKDEVEIGIITIKTVPVKMDDGRILNVSIYPVTFEEYDLFCEDTKRCKKYEPNDRGWGRGKRPVINISWNDAYDYCKWLSKKSGEEYQLPYSKDWLNIARNSKQQDFNFEKCAWYGSKDRTIEVNDTIISEDSLGIKHLYGNISEWCEDKIICGGSFESSCIDFLQEMENYEPNHTYQTIGFRIINEKI